MAGIENDCKVATTRRGHVCGVCQAVGCCGEVLCEGTVVERGGGGGVFF